MTDMMKYFILCGIFVGVRNSFCFDTPYIAANQGILDPLGQFQTHIGVLFKRYSTVERNCRQR